METRDACATNQQSNNLERRRITYSPNVGGDEDDEGERAKPRVTNGEYDVTRYVRSGEVSYRQHHHTHRQG